MELIEAIELKTPKIHWNSNVIIFFQWLSSTAISLILLLVYQKYAAENGIALEKGCEGPGIPFGMLSGFLFLLQLRNSFRSEESNK